MPEIAIREVLTDRLRLVTCRLTALVAEVPDGHGDVMDHARDDVDRAITAGNRETLILARLRILDALDRLASGRYGECALCSAPIPERRLAALPETDRCRPCAERCEHEQHAMSATVEVDDDDE